MRFWVLVVAASSMMAFAADKPGAIKAKVNPNRAGVWIDGKYVGPASRFTVPEKYAAEPGDHEVVLRDPRYEDMTVKVSVQAGKTAVVKGKLTPVTLPNPPFGRLRFGGGAGESFISVASGDVSPVYLNDKFYGYMDELNNAGGGLLLPPGTYRLKCQSDWCGSINQDVTIEANKVTVVALPKKKE
jgi:hypothetical protein